MKFIVSTTNIEVEDYETADIQGALAFVSGYFGTNTFTISRNDVDLDLFVTDGKETFTISEVI